MRLLLNQFATNKLNKTDCSDCEFVSEGDFCLNCRRDLESKTTLKGICPDCGFVNERDLCLNCGANLKGYL
ncbi:MAG: hypothetical protein ABRQ37_03410 [Candidatus Eremiobacterota bacterium]